MKQTPKLNMASIQEEFNKAIDDILVYDSVGKTLHGKVCLVCDKFVSRKELSMMKLKTFLQFTPYLQGDPSIPSSLRSSYQTTIPQLLAATRDLSKSLLSPRSKVVYKKNNRNTQPYIMCCAECKTGLKLSSLQNGKLPKFAIANSLTIGCAPDCLENLNEVELALVSQAWMRGHLFTFGEGVIKASKAGIVFMM